MSKNQSLWEVIENETADEKCNYFVEYDGNFTLVTLESGKFSSWGIAKRNPCDKPDRIRGERIALFRAAEKMMMETPKAPLSKKLLKAVG